MIQEIKSVIATKKRWNSKLYRVYSRENLPESRAFGKFH